METMEIDTKMADFDADEKFARSDAVSQKNYQIAIKHFQKIKEWKAIEQEGKKASIDYICRLNDNTELRMEFKNRRLGAHWNDIALEVYTDNDNRLPGCVFKLIENKVDYYFYTWHGKKKACYIILKAKELCRWWQENWQNYTLRLNKPSTRDNRTWQSSYCFVPIKDIPKEIIYVWVPFVDLNDFTR